MKRLTIITLILSIFLSSQIGFSQCTNDVIAPVAICQNRTVYLNNSGTVTVSANMIDYASSDNCGIASLLVNNASQVTYNCANIGVNVTTLTVTDLSGNTSQCMATVTVIDTIKPVLVCHNLMVSLNSNGTTVVHASSLNSASTDNCGLATLLINNQIRDTFNCSDIGTNYVLLTAMDNSGNTATCSATVTVLDNTPPVISCTAVPLTYSLNNQGLVTVNPNNIALATDACAVAYLSIDGQVSKTYSCSDVGQKTVTITAVDVNGNSSNCLAIINIVDTSNACAVVLAPGHQSSYNGLSVFPNPVQRQVTVKSLDGLIKSIELKLITGQTIARFDNIQNNYYQLDLSQSAGIYLLAVESETGIVYEKLVIE